jgi:hypothetical protein
MLLLRRRFGHSPKMPRLSELAFQLLTTTAEPSVNTSDQAPSNSTLTFDVVDDLVGAHARGRFHGLPERHFVPTEVCPLIELMFEVTDGRTGPLLRIGWLDRVTQMDLRTALASSANVWLDIARRRGFMRTTFDPLNVDDDVQRNRFLMAARGAAEEAGFDKPVAQCLAAALREMESNIHEHSGRAASGIPGSSAKYAPVAAHGHHHALDSSSITSRRPRTFSHLAQDWLPSPRSTVSA